MREEPYNDLLLNYVEHDIKHQLHIKPMQYVHEWGSLIAVYDERNKKTLTLEGHDPSDVDNNNIHDFATSNNNKQQQQDDETTPYITSTLSDNDSGVAADSYGISSNPPSTHTSLNSSSRPPRGIQRKFQQNKNASFRSSISSNSPTSSPELSRKNLKTPGFSRELNRKSLSSNHPMLYSWIDQQDRFNGGYFLGKSQCQNEEEEEEEEEEVASIQSAGSETIQLDQRATKTVDLRPYTTSDGTDIGLVVHNVEEGSYVDRVGELQTADRITEINGKDITTLPNQEALAIYEAALKDDVIELKRARSHSFLKDNLKRQTKALVETKDVPDTVIRASKEAPRPIPKVVNSEPKEAAIEDPLSSTTEVVSADNKHKHIFTIDLIKGSEGLGFTVTSKDVATSKLRTFFIKNVLNRGAAIKDGRLKAGDELLEVNEVQVADKSQQDIVKILRTAVGTVSLQVARLKSELTEEEMSTLSNKALEESLSSTLSNPTSPQPEDILTLTIPLTSIGSAGLGISVKGKHTDSDNQDNGIFVKSVLKGGAAAKDGRLLADDHLLCINDTSLIGLSNNDAMNVLRASLETSMEQGSIRIIIGRPNRGSIHSGYSSGVTSPVTGASPIRKTSPDCGSSPIRRSPVPEKRIQFQRPPSPSLDRTDRGKRTPERFSPRLEMRRRKSSESQESDKDFEDRNSQRGLTDNNFAISRNKSYFRAVHTHALSDSDVVPVREPRSIRTVSVSSMEIPVMQKSRPVYIESGGNTYNVEVRNSMRSSKNKVKELPSYEEALRRRSSNNSSHSSSTTRTEGDSRNGSFKVLPDKYFAISKDEHSLNSADKKIVSLESQLSEKYTMPTTAELNSLMNRQKSLSLDSKQEPLSFLDASGEYANAEMFRTASIASQFSLDSMLGGPNNLPFSRDGFGRLSISEKKGRGQLDAKKSAFYNKLKKFKSMEELRPSVSSEDDILLSTDDLTSLKKTESVDTLISRIDAEEQIQAFRRGEKFSSSTPWYAHQTPTIRGEPIERRKAVRNSLLNDSFKTALDNTTSAPLSTSFSSSTNNAEEKKKKGLLKGIAGMLKKNKKEKSKDGRVLLPEYLVESPPRNRSELSDDFGKYNSNGPRPVSMFESLPKQDNRLFQADQLQKELVQAKIKEMNKKKDTNKKRNKNDTKAATRDSPKGGGNQRNAHKSGYNTWNAHNASNMREKSKQFFQNGGGEESARSSSKSLTFQRQSSLPPRAKKESMEIQRILPRAPSGPMYKSPEQNHKITNRPDRSDSQNSTSAPTSKVNTPIKANVERLPRNTIITNVEDEKKTYSSLSDLTKHGGSVKISHKAEI